MLAPIATATATATGERWRALGTYVVVRVADAHLQGAAEALVREVLAEVDAALSRFRADSELSRANREAGQWLPASDLFVAAVRQALAAAYRTDGLVDPGLGELLIAAGYDRTFDTLRVCPDPVALPTRHTASWRDIGLRENAIRVPVGLALDLGATGKAFAADLAAVTVTHQLDCPVIVSVGGDIRAAAPDGETARDPWEVAIAPDLTTLDESGATTTVSLHAGGLATSSRTGRRWRRGGTLWHHLFDPRTARPTEGPWVSATAWGPTAVDANMVTTAALVLGPDAPDWLSARGDAALLIGDDDIPWVTPAWARALSEGAGPVR